MSAILTEKDIEAIYAIAQPLIGQKAWRVELGVGSFISFDFGQLIVSGRDFSRGEWHFFVGDCAWRLESVDEVYAACQDRRDKLATELKRLEGLTITNIEIASPAFETILTFDECVYLRLFPQYTDNHTRHWLLFLPDRTILRVGPGADWSLESPYDDS